MDLPFRRPIYSAYNNIYSPNRQSTRNKYSIKQKRKSNTRTDSETYKQSRQTFMMHKTRSVD